MFSVGFFTILALLLLAAVYTLMAELRSAKIAYLSISWLPLALLLLMYSYQDFFERTFGYGVILLGMLMAASSLMLGVLGIVLFIRAAGRGEPRLAMAVSTVMALMPVLVYVRLLLA